MNVLAVVPARGGSKRLPGKNLRPLGGRPLLAWTVDAARACAGLRDVLVTTDEPAIAEAGRACGALVPWLRPPHLATDEAGSIDVVLHALDWYEAAHGSVDGVMLLQPTSPLRSIRSIEAALHVFSTDPQRPVIGVGPVPHPPAWIFRIAEDRMTPLLGWEALTWRSQDAPIYQALNGAMYLAAPADLRVRRTFLHEGTRPLPMSAAESVDIDTEVDWRIAEAWLATGAGP